MDRRTFIQTTATSATALMMANQLGASAAFAQTGGLGSTDAYGTPRSSKLRTGSVVAHGDMHNHTLFSDGDGDAARAFGLMRERNLDIAAITDHTSGAKLGSGCGECDPISMNEAEWQQLKDFADSENAPDGGFVAVRGFEWSASVPQTGHMNVWFSETWTDPVATGHAGKSGTAEFVGDGMPGVYEDIEEGVEAYTGQDVPDEIAALFGEAGHAIASDGGEIERAVPDFGAMAGMYEWLMAEPSRPVLGGGSDGIAGFNHPGREPGRFGQFAFNADMEGRVVSIEVFNRREDYLFKGVEFDRQPSPIVQCLNAGWKVGLNGVTDEHGDDAWGDPRDKGRMGLWLPAGGFGRDGIKQAMRRRHFFATNRRGFRLDVAAVDGQGARGFMGEDLMITGDTVSFEIDIDGNDPSGPDNYRGRQLNVQICTQGELMPTVVRTVPITVPGETDDPIVIGDVALDGSPYVFLRICDPARGEDGATRLPVASDFAGVGGAIAYSSPFFISRA